MVWFGFVCWLFVFVCWNSLASSRKVGGRRLRRRLVQYWAGCLPLPLPLPSAWSPPLPGGWTLVALSGGWWQPCPAALQGIDLQPCLLPTHRASLSLSRRLSPLIITALYDCFPQIAASGWPRPCCRPAAADGDSERLQGSWPEEERLLASAANLISSRPSSGSSGLR